MAVIDECLTSVQVACQTIESELLLVDNNSSDNSASHVRRQFPDVIVIPNATNTGFASACNQGADRARGKFLLFVNPDSIPDTDAVTTLLNTWRELTQPGMLVPRLRFPDGRFQPTCRKFPTFQNMFFSRQSLLGKWFGSSATYTLPDYSETMPVEAAAATIALVDREQFLLTGQFDERFFMFMEDTDYCYRLWKRNFRTYFVPDAGAVHDWGRGSRTGHCRRAWYHHLSFQRYFLKHHGGVKTLLLLPLMLGVNLVMSCLFRFAKPGGGTD